MDILLFTIFLVCFFIGISIAFGLRKLEKRNHVCIVVLGDLGRSPRMQYHAKSFAQEGFKVDIIGYPGSTPLKDLEQNSNVTIKYIKPPEDYKRTLPTVLAYIVQTMFQSFQLFKGLVTNYRPSYLLLQNPPAIPTIPICWFYCLMVQAEFMIDWHNYTHSILSLSLGAEHFIVKIALLVEFYFGSKAYKNFCVTKAMRDDLSNTWYINATVLYDRPLDIFHPIGFKEKHDFFIKLGKEYNIFKASDVECSTVFTKIEDGKVVLRNDRPALIVSSTSWTEDEDFSILLNALNIYENSCDNESISLPNIICVITGKGPLKQFYQVIIKKRKWKHITIVTPWLEQEEYPKMLASADLGISLHTSSSGLDLPMKIVDMFGCGLPVCAYNFKCLNELVKHNENGFIFSTDMELAEQLKMWFKDFPNNLEQQGKYNSFKQKLDKFRQLQWHGNWLQHVFPYFNQQN